MLNGFRGLTAAGLGVSVLLRAGFRDVRNLLGEMTAWKALALPVDESS